MHLGHFKSFLKQGETPINKQKAHKYKKKKIFKRNTLAFLPQSVEN